MKLKTESVFVGEITTIGRRTGLKRKVEIRLVYLDGCFYASTSSVRNKHWCRNLIKNRAVEVRAAGERFVCEARQVSDEKLRLRVLALRDSPSLLERAVFELKPVHK